MRFCEFAQVVDWESINLQEITLIIPLKKKDKIIRDSEIDIDRGVIFDASEDAVTDKYLYQKNGIKVDDVEVIEDDGIKYIKDKYDKYYIVIW